MTKQPKNNTDASLKCRVSLPVEVFWGKEWVATTGEVISAQTIKARVIDWRGNEAISRFTNTRKHTAWRRL